MVGREHGSGSRLPNGVHRGKLAGLSQEDRRLAVEARRRERERGNQEEKYPRIGKCWHRLPYGVRGVQSMPETSLKDCLGYANKQVSVDLLAAMGVSRVSGLRKQLVIDRIVAEVDLLPKVLELKLASCRDEAFSSFMMMLDKPGGAFTFAGGDNAGADDLVPFEPFVWVFYCDGCYHAFIPREIIAAAQRVDVGKIKRERNRRQQLPLAIGALREYCGVAPISEVVSCCNELFGFEPDILEVCDYLRTHPLEVWSQYGQEVSYGCWPSGAPAPSSHIVHSSLSDLYVGDVAQARSARYRCADSFSARAPWSTDGCGVIDYGTLREAELRARDTYIKMLLMTRSQGPERRQFNPEMGVDGALKWMRNLPEAIAVRAWLDEHVPDREDDFTYADDTLGYLISWRHSYPEGRRLVMCAESLHLFEHTYDRLELADLLVNLEDVLPSWDLNGWSPRELRERAAGESGMVQEKDEGLSAA